jgi:acyl-CoA synthetase (AMP-forming)/AMP-acid ligase II
MDIRSNSLHNIIEQNAKFYSDSVAFKYEDSSITFLDFFNKVEQLSAGLTNLPLKQKKHIALLSDNNPDYLIICGACSKLNIVLTLLNCRQSAAEQIAILSNITPDMIIYQEKYMDVAEGIISAFSQVQSYIISDKILENNLKSLYIDQKTMVYQEIKQEDPYIIIPTAAVEGVAKGAVLSQSNMLNSIQLMASAYGQDKLARHLAFLPLYHILGLCGTLATFCLGGENVIMEKYEPDQVAELIHQEQITYFGTFPPILEKIIDASEHLHLDLSCLKMVYGIEGPPQIERLREKFQCPFYVGFGQTETSGFVTAGVYADYPGTAGKIEMMNRVEIMGEGGQLMALGQEGEIVVKGPMVFLNYWNFPDETAYAFRNGWLHTGDLGKIQTNGVLQYLGRKPEKALIKTGGENVYPGEIEKLLNQHPDVADCVVFGIPDEEWGEAVCAAILPKSGKKIAEKELTNHITNALARYKKPKHWFFLEEFPVKEGKVDREQIKSICLNFD